VPETIYMCQNCGTRVLPGDGYIHTTSVTGWAIHHKDCAPDLTDEVCFGVPFHWSDLLDAHWWLAQQRNECAVTR
jgi:hypothetical protein